MLYDLEGFAAKLRREYVAADMTVIVAVRLHQANPWVIERIEALANYYQPAPRLLVVDFGSQGVCAPRVAEACERSGIECVRVEDDGVFSLARARNCGAVVAKTDLLFFSDVDCFGERDLFARLAAFANASDLGACFDQVVNLPVYHLGADATARFFAAADESARGAELSRALHQSVFCAPLTTAEYVDPHSNFFMIRRDFFDYVGGYNENFRGHGSEDFEFFVRLAMYSLQFPQPEALLENAFGPRDEAFHGPKPYRGFRRLMELMAVPAQLAGLRIAHLHHARAMDASGWYENRDTLRSRFEEQLLPVLSHRTRLLDYDWMPRPKRALVLIRQESHVDAFLPLRMAGYKLTAVHSEDAASLTQALSLLDERRVDAVAVLNPYMKSHADLKPVFDRARQLGIRTIVFERGALPESWYYGPDMSYADPEYGSLRLREESFSAEELALATEYMARLRTGSATLESNGDYTDTYRRLSPLRETHKRICLVPLQLHDDVAVTRFAEGFPDYQAFVRDLPGVAAAHPDVLFLVKAHPLSKEPLQGLSANVTLCEAQDNIHALLDVAHAVICYNSGVGLLALIHEKKLVTLGNAFYNLPGLGERAPNFAAAVALAFDDASARFHTMSIHLFVTWLLCRKYSFFRGESVIREVSGRRIHGFRNLLWYRLNFEQSTSTRRALLDAPVAARSYAAAQLGIGEELSSQAAMERAWMLSGDGNRQVTSSNKSRRRLSAKLEKLVREPKRFFTESRQPFMRSLAVAVPESAGNAAVASKLGKLLRDPRRFFAEAKPLGLGRSQGQSDVTRARPPGEPSGSSARHTSRDGGYTPADSVDKTPPPVSVPSHPVAPAQRYSIDDLTLVIAVRLHDANPWVLERLAALPTHFSPLPLVLIVDFGSEGEAQSKVEAACRERGFTYLYEPDTGVYSAAVARNLGARAVLTKLIFFCDADCFGARDLFARLIEHANDIALSTELDQVVSLPVYHLSESATLALTRLPEGEARNLSLGRSFNLGAVQERGREVDFVAPYSNCLLVRRDFFEIVGGYDRSFRGHGSEDFEFLLRAALISGFFPVPEDVMADVDGPLRSGFYGPRAYRGFRRLLELTSFRAEIAGLRIAHLHHQQGQGGDTWFARNDWERSRFNQVVRDYLDRPGRMLEHDSLSRDKCAWVVCGEDDYRRYLPLRLQGYRLRYVGSASEVSVATRENLTPELVATSSAMRGAHSWIDSLLAKYPARLVDGPDQLLPDGSRWTVTSQRFAQASYIAGRLALPRA